MSTKQRQLVGLDTEVGDQRSKPEEFAAHAWVGHGASLVLAENEIALARNQVVEKISKGAR